MTKINVKLRDKLSIEIEYELVVEERTYDGYIIKPFYITEFVYTKLLNNNEVISSTYMSTQNYLNIGPIERYIDKNIPPLYNPETAMNVIKSKELYGRTITHRMHFENPKNTKKIYVLLIKEEADSIINAFDKIKQEERSKNLKAAEILYAEEAKEAKKEAEIKERLERQEKQRKRVLGKIESVEVKEKNIIDEDEGSCTTKYTYIIKHKDGSIQTFIETDQFDFGACIHLIEDNQRYVLTCVDGKKAWGYYQNDNIRIKRLFTVKDSIALEVLDVISKVKGIRM